MPVVGHADEHGVDVLASQDLAIVDVGIDAAAEDLLGVDPPALVEVGGRHQLDARDLEGRLGVDEADDAHADRGDPDAVIRPTLLGKLDFGFELVNVLRRQAGRDGRGDRGSGHGPDERTTRVEFGIVHEVLLRSLRVF